MSDSASIKDAPLPVHLRTLAGRSALAGDLAQRLEETHLAAWSDRAESRAIFCGVLASSLARLPDSQVCVISGALVEDMYSFCTQLERQLGVGRVRRRVDGGGGVVDALRHRPRVVAGKPLKRRYILWDDAHVLLAKDPALFGVLVDALLGAAAESEFVSDDILLLQRIVFVGSPAMDLYAEDERSQFNRWLAEGQERPLWQVITGVKRPAVASARVEELLGTPARRSSVAGSLPSVTT